MRGMRTTFALLLAVAGNAQAGTADCDGDAARVLHAAAHAATDARAYWLDGTRIRWPAQPADARYRLVASSSAGLRVERGQAVAGADRSYLLQASHDLPDAVAARFRFVGEGATLRLPDEAKAGLRPTCRSTSCTCATSRRRCQRAGRAPRQVPGLHRAGSNGMRHLRALADAGLTDVHLLPVFDIASVPEKPAAPRPARRRARTATRSRPR
jgi:hypothetical protein